MLRRLLPFVCLGVLACLVLGWVQQPSLPLPAWATLNVTAPLNPRHPLNRGLVGHWQVLPQTNQAGSLWRSTAPMVGPLSGTLTGMLPTSTASGWNATRRPGGYGEMRFDGTNDYVDLGVNTIGSRLNGAAGITVSFWVNYTTLVGAPGPGANIFVNAKCGVDDGTLVRFGFTGDAPGAIKIVARSSVSDTDQGMIGTVVLTAGTWAHAVGVVDFPAQTLTLYINGALDSTLGVTFGSATYVNSAASIPDILGADSTSAFGFAGLLDDVRVLARALSAVEAAALYRETSSVRNATLQWLPLLVAKTGVVVVPRRMQQY